MTRARLAIAALGLLGCGTRTIEERRTAEARGEALVDATSLSSSRFNGFSCTTCHPKVSPPPGRTLPAPPLAGALSRPSFWGGRFLDLGDAVDECLTHFMRGKPLDRRGDAARDLWAYLASIASQGPSAAQPFDVVGKIVDLPRGDAGRGEATWKATCAPCHGPAHTGEGRLPGATIVPEDTIDFHRGDGGDVIRQVVIEKTRHGSFLGFAGTMPPFTRDRLSDGDLSDLIAHLGLR